MDTRVRIVLVDHAKGDAEMTYCGPDSIEADKAFGRAAADEMNVCVRMFIYPMPMKTAHPAAEKAEIAARKESAQLREQTKRDGLIKAAQAEVEKAQKKLVTLQGASGQAADLLRPGLEANVERAQRKLESLKEEGPGGEEAEAEKAKADGEGDGKKKSGKQAKPGQ